MRERTLERKLETSISQIGGMCLKLVSPGNAGVPDRIVLLPGGVAIFVEVKADTGELSRLQRWRIAKMRALGCEVRVLQGMGAVEEFITECREWGWLEV